MYSRQLDGLRESLLKRDISGATYLVLEKFALKKKKFKQLRVGDCIYLSKSMPRVFIKKEQVYKEVFLYPNGDTLKAKVLDRKFSDIDSYNKRVTIEPIVAVIINDSTKELELYVDIFNKIYLYKDNSIFASASLKVEKRGYILEIEELFNE